MIHKNQLTDEVILELDKRLEGIDIELEIPPAVFVDMKGKMEKFDKAEQSLICRFPVLENQLNPFGNMQGGVISAAIDNTIGPLSMLVASPNVTRHLEIKYIKAITPVMKTILVKARLVDQQKRFLFFEAVVTNSDGMVCATAKAKHFIFV